jgi:serine/threonine-protein kinase RsbW
VTPTVDVIRLDLPATYKYLNILGSSINGMIERVDDLAEAEIVSYNIQLGVNEIFANIVGHAYSDDESQRVDVTLALLGEPRRLVVELHDTGASFNPEAVPLPNLDDAQIRGYGLFLVEQLLDEVEYQPQPGGNCWRLVKYL